MSKISFVYFDVGGVAIKDFSDTNKWDLMFQELAFGDTASRAKDIYSEHDDDICLGKMSVDDLILIYKEELKLSFPNNFDFLQNFVDRFDTNDGIQKIIVKLIGKVKIGLLTDMYPGMLSRIFDKNLIPLQLWDVIVDSSVEKVRKPMPEIYELAQKKAGVPAGEILFIDNRQKNLDGATRAGWQTYLYDSSDYDHANIDLAKFISQNL